MKRIRRVAVTAVAALTALAGCSLVEATTRARTRRLARRGIVDHEIDLAGDHLHYWEGGRGKHTVVLLHGFGGNALYQWYPQLQALSEHYRVIAPDLLWFGESHSQYADYSLEHQARAVSLLLDYEKAHRVHIIGLSYGGLVTHEVVARDPERFDRVVLVSSPARAFHADDKRDVLADFGVATASDLLLPEDHAGVERLLSLAYADPPWVPRLVANDIVDQFYAPHRRQHVSMLEAVPASTASQRAAFEVPTHETLIIWGQEDRVFPERAAWRLARELGERAHVCVFSDAAHAPHLERTDDVNRLIIGFLGGQGVRCIGRSVEVADHVLEG